MQIQISWLLQKPTDLDLHCLQRQGISGLSRTRVKSQHKSKKLLWQWKSWLLFLKKPQYYPWKEQIFWLTEPHYTRFCWTHHWIDQLVPLPFQSLILQPHFLPSFKGMEYLACHFFTIYVSVEVSKNCLSSPTKVFTCKLCCFLMSAFISLHKD